MEPTGQTTTHTALHVRGGYGSFGKLPNKTSAREYRRGQGGIRRGLSLGGRIGFLLSYTRIIVVVGIVASVFVVLSYGFLLASGARQNFESIGGNLAGRYDGSASGKRVDRGCLSLPESLARGTGSSIPVLACFGNLV